MKNVMIVDDNCLTAEGIEKNIDWSALDATVIAVEYNSLSALDILKDTHVDLIISDIMMPNMDGYELVRSLRDAGDSIPVLMVTAKDAFDDMRMGFLSGTDDYMIKPVNINELVLRVGALLRRAQMINERKQRIGDTILECDSLTVSTSSENMVLPQKEFMLLYKMVSFPGKRLNSLSR